MSSSPRKRSVEDLKTITPNKVRNSRRPVDLCVAKIADGTIALVIAKFAGRPNLEPFTNPIRNAIINKTRDDYDSSQLNRLTRNGFFNVVVLVASSDSDVPIRTTRGYDFKAFVSSKDTVCASAELKQLGEEVIQVSNGMDALCTMVDFSNVCLVSKFKQRKQVRVLPTSRKLEFDSRRSCGCI